jgi:hypothetical protein
MTSFKISNSVCKECLLIEPYSFGVEKADDLPVELAEIQRYSVLEQIFFYESWMVKFYARLSADRLFKSFQSECQIYATFGCTDIYEELFSLMKKKTKLPRNQN